ncbi:hypothetical protein EGR_07046 [Echinococcus granulosus]|uniref:Uncharacterized protein n=1 Tax=Echinococcus granulosus TaxID=6210 RepID=U6JH73_ECHGR|nr:hypothetical protein EGR_07046 [Echinococcus granulosus]EUB58126.1 hypothetical protein EGR_07046 [Echinococcus granulosus]CDS22706.1 hypothetical protein EgrG_001189000 [Echinococcus granulosus]
MSREHPDIFQHIFQIPDTPEKITCDNSDCEAMYKRSTVLYLRPLSLAVYMRRLDVIKLLIDNQLVDNGEVSYATDINGRLEDDDEVELREIRPMTIAARRNILEALPVLFSSNTQTLKASDSFTLRYANKWVEKCNKFKDILDYTISVVRKKRLLPTTRVFEMLVYRCPGYCSANSAQLLCTKHGGQRCSLFQRLAKYLLLEAGGNRLALPLLQSLDQLIRHKGFYKLSKRLESAWLYHYSFTDITENWDTMSVALKDRLITLAYMFKIHEILQEKAKPLTLSYTTRLISEMIYSVGCGLDLMTTPIAEMQQSIQFLLHSGLTTFEQRVVTEEGDLEQFKQRRSGSPKTSQNLKSPTKKALQVLLYNLKSFISSDYLQSRVNKVRNNPHNIYANSAEPSRCLMCMKEAKEKFALIEPLPVEAQHSLSEINPLVTLTTDLEPSPKASTSMTTSTLIRTCVVNQFAGTLKEPTLHHEEKEEPEEMEPTPTVLMETTPDDMTVAPVVEENPATPRLVFSTLSFGEASPIVTDARTFLSPLTGTNIVSDETLQTDYLEQRGVETYLTQQFCSADEESVTSEKLLPKQRPRVPCNLVEVDNLIEKIANNTALINDFLLSDDDNDLIDSTLKGCLKKTEIGFASGVEISEGPASQTLCQFKCTEA